MVDLLKPRGRRTNHKKGIAAMLKDAKRAEAEKRQATYDKLTLAQKLDKLDAGGHKAMSQRVRLAGVK